MKPTDHSDFFGCLLLIGVGMFFAWVAFVFYEIVIRAILLCTVLNIERACLR